jgi:hypothetical protein
MFFKRFFLFGLLALLIFALIGGRARSSFADGYTQGYVAGLQAAAPQSGETPGQATAPPVSPRFDGHAHGWGFFALFGLLLLGLPFFMMLLGFGFLFRRRRHWHRRPGGRDWHRDQRPGGRGPADGDAPREKRPEDVEPDIHEA